MERRGSFLSALPRFVEGSKAGLKASAEEIMAVADVLVPKDTLTLANSRFIDEPQEGLDGPSISFGFGHGEAVNPKDGKLASQYAVPVHEILEAKHAPPTQAKYLETPCLAYEAKMEETMGRYIRTYTRDEGGLITSTLEPGI